MKPIHLISTLLLVSLLISCNSKVIGVPDSPYPTSDDSFSRDTVATGFVIPYGIAVITDNEYLITDRIGKLFHIKNDEKTEITGMPKVESFGTPGLAAILHGGLMEVSLHPNYETNGWVYISYLAEGGHAKVARLKILNHTATGFEEIFSTRSTNYTGNGMRIVWQDNIHFFLGVGNSNWSSASNPVLNAQDFNDDAGKIHRLMDDGTVPTDNPILAGHAAATTIWSYGHRDVQGIVYDASTNTLFGIEHGPKGGDEFNIIEKGKNYGWPLFSHGIDYTGESASVISKDSAATFTILAEHFWTVPTRDGGQAVAPACLLKVDNSTISDWNGNFLFGSLAYRRLMKYNRETDETFGLNIEGRVRSLSQLPSGDILVLIERNHLEKSNGMVVRIGG